MEEKELEYCDCYAKTIPYLIDKASVYIGLRGSNKLNKLGSDLTLEQFITLDAISTGKNLCQRDLAKILLKDRSNITRILNILEKKGLITREDAKKGNRIVKLPEITKLGKEYLEKYAIPMKRDLEELLSQVDEKELKIMEKVLKQISAKISEEVSIQI